MAITVALWAGSFPGFHFPGFVLALGTLLLLALIWGVCVIVLFVQVLRRRTSHLKQRFGWLFVAPIAGSLTIAALTFDIPLRTRFMCSRNDFEEVVTTIEQDPESADSLEGQIGSFSIRTIRRIPDGWLFYEANGAFIDHAGFAYLPLGPTPYQDTAFESPQYRHLIGPWYAFISSW